MKKIKVFIYDARGLTQWLTKKYSDRIEILPEHSRRNADIYILWHDGPAHNGFSYTDEARQFDIPSMVIQHGRASTTVYTKKRKYNFKEFDNSLSADKICVWGEKDKERLLSANFKKDRIAVTGCPFLDDIGAKEKHEGITIFFSVIHWPLEEKEVDGNFEILNELIKNKHKIIVKIIHQNNEEAFKQYEGFDNIKVVNTHPANKNHFPVSMDYLRKCDVLVCANESTNAFFAQALDIPVIAVTDIFNIWNEKADDRYSKAVYQTKINDLNKTIEQVLSNDSQHKERMKVTVDEGGYGLNPTYNMFNEIVKIVKENPVFHIKEVIDQFRSYFSHSELRAMIDDDIDDKLEMKIFKIIRFIKLLKE